MPNLTIRDPIHGVITLSEQEKRVIDTTEFQRLRGVKQLAMAQLVYPGATHSRFEHSLGTLYLASRIASRLNLEDEIREKVRLFALLHDVGHCAFSHEGERVLKEKGNHEKWMVEIIKKSEISSIISENYSLNELVEFGNSSYGEIIHGDIGADRLDYLLRDSHYTGVAYGIVDKERLIERMFFENGLGVDAGGLEASESLLIARFMMYSTVYQHRTVRIASAMLRRALHNALNEGLRFEEMFSKDCVVFEKLLSFPSAKDYALSLQNRRLYKEVYSLPSLNNPEKWERILKEECDCDVIIDMPYSFSKLKGFKIKTAEGIKDIMDVSALLSSLVSAEKSRNMVLILAPKEKREIARKKSEMLLEH